MTIPVEAGTYVNHMPRKLRKKLMDAVLKAALTDDREWTVVCNAPRLMTARYPGNFFIEFSLYEDICGT